MISKKAIVAWVFSAVVGVGMLASPSRALAHDHDGDGDGRGHQQWHHDNGQHRGWDNHRGHDGDEHRSYNQRPYGNGWGYRNGYGYRNHEPDRDEGYGWNQRGYGYRQPSYNYPANGAGMVNRRNPNLVWTCDSQGHHCRWAQRYGYNNYNSGLNPFAFGGNNGYADNYGNYGNGYYGGNNGYSGNSMGGLGSFLGPLFGGQQP
jgi:hypothetical protein